MHGGLIIYLKWKSCLSSHYTPHISLPGQWRTSLETLLSSVLIISASSQTSVKNSASTFIHWLPDLEPKSALTGDFSGTELLRVTLRVRQFALNTQGTGRNSGTPVQVRRSSERCRPGSKLGEAEDFAYTALGQSARLCMKACSIIQAPRDVFMIGKKGSGTAIRSGGLNSVPLVFSFSHACITHMVGTRIICNWELFPGMNKTQTGG
ncbi:hypothetical protein BGZ63DRAFT_385323 [Mariannaea sp. PMI_226]|nr:hypothetical protein BGZ63DRAFT_385323 [Mariannaea sp. PMI_226]